MTHYDFCLTQYVPAGPCICAKVRQPVFVTMCYNPTGEVIRFKYDHPWGDGSEFYWSEGNYSCDCNRELEWREAHGLERMPPDDGGPSYCKGDGKYFVEKIELCDGTVVYSEVDETRDL